MLRTCVIDFGDPWDHYLVLVEFSYNNINHLSIQIAPFEMPYDRRSDLQWVGLTLLR